MAPFDLVLLLVLSNAVQNSMIGSDSSLIGGLISAGSLVFINYVMGWLTARSKTIERMVEGRPSILVHDGHIDHKAMGTARMTMHELDASLRDAGVTNVQNVRFAILENSGSISVITKSAPL